jgi:hypothetical protein
MILGWTMRPNLLGWRNGSKSWIADFGRKDFLWGNREERYEWKGFCRVCNLAVLLSQRFTSVSYLLA